LLPHFQHAFMSQRALRTGENTAAVGSDRSADLVPVFPCAAQLRCDFSGCEFHRGVLTALFRGLQATHAWPVHQLQLCFVALFGDSAETPRVRASLTALLCCDPLTLRYLDLKGCQLGEEGVRTVADALLNNRSLTWCGSALQYYASRVPPGGGGS